MEKLSMFFLIIIAAYFIYGFIKSRQKKEARTETDILEEKKEKTDNYRYIIVAAIAATMKDSPYRTKRVFLISESDERFSSWKVFGRQESIIRRMFLRGR